MKREQVESAIEELERLLIEDSDAEEDYQRWFEDHPIVFLSLGYMGSIPHPRLRTADGRLYIPDFLAQRPNAAWEIVEIKTPQAAILRDLDRRSTFYALFEQYLSQCHEYAEAIHDQAVRNAMQQDYGIQLHRQPTSVLVSGRSVGLDQEKLLTLTARRTPPIVVFTFDDLRNALNAFRTFNFGSYDTAAGFGLYADIVIHRSEPEYVNNYLFDLGVHADRDRASVFINGSGYLRLDLWDSSGRKHEARSSEPLTLQDYDVPRFLEIEAGSGQDFGFMSIVLEGRYRADIRIEKLPFGLSHEYVLGSDWSARGFSWFAAKQIMVHDRPLAFEEKLQLRRYVFLRRDETDYGWSVEFRGHKFMSTKGHPLTARSP